jgi:hypothetical protein
MKRPLWRPEWIGGKSGDGPAGGMKGAEQGCGKERNAAGREVRSCPHRIEAAALHQSLRADLRQGAKKVAGRLPLSGRPLLS